MEFLPGVALRVNDVASIADVPMDRLEGFAEAQWSDGGSSGGLGGG